MIVGSFWSSGGLQEPPWASLGPPVKKSNPFSVNSPPGLVPIGGSFWEVIAYVRAVLPSFSGTVFGWVPGSFRKSSGWPNIHK